jgi:hypothetical protein
MLNQYQVFLPFPRLVRLIRQHRRRQTPPAAYLYQHILRHFNEGTDLALRIASYIQEQRGMVLDQYIKAGDDHYLERHGDW